MRDLADWVFRVLVEGKPTPDDLQATGNCYEDAGQYAMDHADWTLVHGRPTLRRPPFVEYGHAWVEKGDEVFDPSTGFKGPKFLYYSLGNIDYRDNLVYPHAVLLDFLRLARHWGPWEGPDGVPPKPERVKEWKNAGKKLPKSQKAKRPKNPFSDIEKLFQKDNS